MMRMMTIIYVDYFVDNDNWWYHDIEFDDHSYKSAQKIWNSVFAWKLIVRESGLKKKMPLKANSTYL